MLMLTILYPTKTKTPCKESFLVKKEKTSCSGCKHLFFAKNFLNKEFLSQDDEKLSASAKGKQGTQKYLTVLQLLWRMQLQYLEVSTSLARTVHRMLYKFYNYAGKYTSLVL
jgi:hypothetical protein